MSIKKIDRREALKMSGMGMLGLLLPGLQREPSTPASVPEPAVININANYGKGQWIFDPVGLYIQKGQKVRWIAKQWGGTVMAFHPSNDNHELRIPENAKPFNSGMVPLMMTGWKGLNQFEWTFDVEGTYDYFSRDEEIMGMVGRIVVGKPGGPAEKNAPGYGGRDGRAVVFPREVTMLGFCPSADIVAKKTIPYPKDYLVHPHPYGAEG